MWETLGSIARRLSATSRWAEGPGPQGVGRGVLRCPPRCPTAAVRGAGPPGTPVGAGQDGDHVHALPGTLQRPDASPPPLPGLWLREYPPPSPHLPARPCPPCPLQPVQKRWALTRPDMCVTSFGPHVSTCEAGLPQPLIPFLQMQPEAQAG